MQLRNYSGSSTQRHGKTTRNVEPLLGLVSNSRLAFRSSHNRFTIEIPYSFGISLECRNPDNEDNVGAFPISAVVLSSDCDCRGSGGPAARIQDPHSIRDWYYGHKTSIFLLGRRLQAPRGRSFLHARCISMRSGSGSAGCVEPSPYIPPELPLIRDHAFLEKVLGPCQRL